MLFIFYRQYVHQQHVQGRPPPNYLYHARWFQRHPEKVKAHHKSRVPRGRGDGGELKEVMLFGGLLNLIEIKDANGKGYLYICVHNFVEGS
jgi:hypothetical protein